jgi:Zn finger protein HypA/HybF involved in hydrogenase expression
MTSEIYCEYCRDFQPFTTDSSSVLCGNCGCTVLRLNWRGEKIYCEDCSGYQQPSYEELHAPVPSDLFYEDNRGYRVGDVICSRCASILAVVRKRANAEVSA